MSATETPFDVYLSCASSGASVGKVVGKYLTKAGLNVWSPLDGADDSPAPWLSQSHRVIASARYLLLVLTPDADPSWQLAEVDFADRARCLYQNLQIVPIIREGFEPQPSVSVFLQRFSPIELSGDRAALSSCMLSLVRRLKSPPAMPSMPPDAVEGSVYPGPRAYGLLDGARFFGRDAEIAEAVRRLGTQPGGQFHRWLHIEGSAGIGKASMARAGVVPAIARGALAGGPSRWRIAAFRPYADPMANLRSALGGVFFELLSNPELDSALREPSGLCDLAEEHLPDGEGILLVVDHLDDLLSLSPDRRHDGRRMEALLAEALSSFDQRVFLVTTGRADLTRSLLRTCRRLDALDPTRRALYHLGGLSRRGLGELLEGPTHRASRRWSPSLSARLLHDAERTSHAPTKINWMLAALCRGAASVARYEQLGGIDDGFGRASSAQLEGLGSDDQQRAKTLLLALVSPGRGRSDLPIALSYSDAVVAAGGGPRAEALIERLEQGVDLPAADGAPLITLTEAAEGHCVRLTAGDLPRRWPVLADLIETHRGALERRSDIEDAATQWLNAGAAPTELPDGPTLAVYAGADLDPVSAQMLRGSLREASRRFVEAAKARSKSGLIASEEAQAARQRAELDSVLGQRKRAERQARRLLAMAIILLLVGAGLGVLAYLANQKIEELEQQVSWAVRERLKYDTQRAEADKLNFETQKKLLDVESLKRAIDQKRRQARKAGAKAEQSADTVLSFAIEAAVEADDYFRRINTNDGKYARRKYADAVLQRIHRRLEEAPNNRRLGFLLARQHTLLGDLAVDLQVLRTARPNYEAAVKALTELVAKQPTDLSYQQALGSAHDRLGAFLAKRRKTAQFRDLQAAVEQFEASVKVWQALVAHDKTDPLYAHSLAQATAQLGLTQLELKGPVAARQSVLSALAQTTRLYEASPDDPDLQHDLARRISYAGDLEVAAGHADAAHTHYARAVDLIRSLVKTHPDRTEFGRTSMRIRRKQRAAPPRSAATPPN